MSHIPKPLLILAVLLLTSCQARSADDARLRVLEREVEQLKLDVEALRAQATNATSARADSGMAGPKPAAEKTTVTFTFDVEPESAIITVDGKRVTDAQWSGPRDDQQRSVRITRMGFRSLSQGVSASKDRRLVYRLTPGRGFARLPPR